MTKSNKIIIWSVVSVILLATAILGTVFDLQISMALADLESSSYLTKNFFAIVGETIGENVLYILLVSSLAIIFFYLVKKPLTKKWLNYALMAFCIVASLVISFYCINKTLGYVAEHTTFGLDEFLESTLGTLIVILFSAGVDLCAFLLFNKLSVETLSSLWKWAVFVIIVAALSNGIVQGAKHIFDRTRYRAMVYVGDAEFSFYTPWYQINTNKFNSISAFAEDFFKSFPSGHTCAAASTFVLVALPIFFEKTNTKKCKAILWTTAIVYTLLVAISRIVAGAHFFMDVFIGGLVTFVITIVLLALYKKYILPKTLNKKQ